MDDDKLYIEVSDRKLFVSDIAIDVISLERMIQNKNLQVLSILPTSSQLDKPDSNICKHVDFYCDIIRKLLSLAISNQIRLNTIELPFLTDDIIIFLRYLHVDTLVILDFTCIDYTQDKLYEYLSEGSIKKISYLCDNDNCDNNLIVNELAKTFNAIKWGCYFVKQDDTSIEELDIFNYIVPFNGKKFNVKIKLGELVSINSNVLEFEKLPPNSCGVITKWFVNKTNVYDICWNTVKNKDYLICHNTDKKCKMICNDVIKYINKKYPKSGITQANNICTIEEWNNMEAV